MWAEGGAVGMKERRRWQGTNSNGTRGLDYKRLSELARATDNVIKRGRSREFVFPGCGTNSCMIPALASVVIGGEVCARAVAGLGGDEEAAQSADGLICRGAGSTLACERHVSRISEQ